MYLKKKSLIIFLFLSIPLFIAIVNAGVPGTPGSLSWTNTGNFWVNYTWTAGENTDSFNISINGSWTNGTEDAFINTKSSPHGWVNISVAGFNETSQLLSDFEYASTQVKNNEITLTNVSGSYSLYEGQTLYIDADYIDADNDTGTFSTDAKGAFDPGTGILSWKTAGGDGAKDGRTYGWSINVTDGYGSSMGKEFFVTVYGNLPGNPTGFDHTTGNFWVNHTWLAGANTDSFNVSVNGIWDNGSAALYRNTTGSPHEWVNISVAGYNASSQLLSDFVKRDIRISNNLIKLTNVSDRYFLNEGDSLYIDADFSDYDGDTGNFSTNAEKGIFDPSTGVLSWNTATGDGGIYNWLISVTDGYGSISTWQFKVIVPLRLKIKFIEPAIINGKEQWVNAKVGHMGKFIGTDATFRNTGEDSLVLKVTEIYNNTRTELPIITLAKDQSMSYKKEFEINSTGVIDELFNYTFEVEAKGFNGNEFTFRYSNITVISLPVIPIFKTKRANADIVIVSEGSRTPPVIYTLEANSSVDLVNVSIFDPFYPASQGGPYFNISKLEANKGSSINFSYQASTADLSSNKCDEGFSCIINLATFEGRIESTGELINDTDYVEIWVNPPPVGTTTSGTTSSGSGGSGGSSGGGGGGGGMPPSEDFKNIERREVREMDVLARSSAAYVFKEADPVMVVGFESNVSEYGVPVAVEVLKNRSKYIGTDAPGELYKYFNVFVGVSGFNKKIGNGVVIYRVPNAWIKEKGLDPMDISLYKWEGRWVRKNTEIADANQNHTYYASLVGNFSSFAIAAAKKTGTASDSGTMTSNSNGSNSTIVSNESDNTTQPSAKPNFSIVELLRNALSLLVLVLILGILGIVYYLKKIK